MTHSRSLTAKIHRTFTVLILAIFTSMNIVVYLPMSVFGATEGAPLSPQGAGIGSGPFQRLNQSEFFNACGGGDGGSTTPTASGDLGNVYMLGDSITLGAQQSGIEDKFKEAGAKEVTISASGGGNLGSPGTTGTRKSGYDAIESDKSTIKAANTIIVAHGTNQMENNVGSPSDSNAYVSNSQESIKEAIKKIKATGTSGKIYWVDVAISAAGPGIYPSFVHLIDKAIYASASEEGYTTISWAKKVDSSYDPANATGPVNDSQNYLADGIHPSSAGYPVYMDTVVNGAKSGGGNGSEDNQTTGTSNEDDTNSNKGSGGSLQQIADDAVREGEGKNINVAIKISGDQSASAGEQGQMPSASVIKLLVAAALSKKNVPLASVSNDLELMIRDSNNEAANRLIDRAGGVGDINNVASELGIGSDAHIGRKMLESVGGADPNTISSKGSDSLLGEFKKSSEGSGQISQDYANAVIDAMKAQTVATKWGSSGIPKENMAHKTGELNGAQHDVGFFIKGDKWLTVTTMTNEPGGDGSQGVELVKTTAKKIYDAWGGDSETTAEDDGCCASGDSSGTSGGGAGDPLPESVPEPWRTLINDAAEKHPDSDRRIVAATLWAENRGWPEYKEGSSTTSGVGAVGFWQFMPQSWAAMGEDGDGDGVKDPKNPKDAVHGAFNHSPDSAGKPIIYEGTGDLEGDYETKKFYRNDEAKKSLLTYMANYNGNDGSAIEGSTLPNFQRAQNGDYVRMGYWLMASNFEKGWMPEADELVDASAQGPGAKGGSASTLTSSNTSGKNCAKKSDSAFGEGIVAAAKEMATWGEKYNSCYVYGSGHGSREDLEKRIDNHFSGSENAVDCSAFVTAVILKGTGEYVPGNTNSFCDGGEFEKIPIAQAQPGDLSIDCNAHVEVITEVKGPSDFITSGSHMDGCGPDHGASPGTYKGTESFVLRFKGAKK